MIYRSAEGSVSITFPHPAPANGHIFPDLKSHDSLVESQTVSIFPQMRGSVFGSWITNYYSQIEVELGLDDEAFFSPLDNPAWPLQSVVWTPKPFKQNGNRAVYRFGRLGDWCWILPEDGLGIVSEGFALQGLPIRARGLDAIGQPFDIRQLLFTISTSFHESKRFITIPKIPKKEWPMRFERKNDHVTKELEVNGVMISLKGYTLTIGNTRVQLAPLSSGQAGPG